MLEYLIRQLTGFITESNIKVHENKKSKLND